MKEDKIIVALYQLAFSNYNKAREFEKELIEYLDKNYKILKDGHDIQSFVADNLYGNDNDTSNFIKK